VTWSSNQPPITSDELQSLRQHITYCLYMITRSCLFGGFGQLHTHPTFPNCRHNS